MKTPEFVLLVAVATSSLAGAAEHNAKLVGQWEEFRGSGEFSLEADGTGSWNDTKIFWETRPGELLVSWPSCQNGALEGKLPARSIERLEYRLRGDELRTHAPQTVTSWVRKGPKTTGIRASNAERLEDALVTGAWCKEVKPDADDVKAIAGTKRYTHVMVFGAEGVVETSQTVSELGGGRWPDRWSSRTDEEPFFREFWKIAEGQVWTSGDREKWEPSAIRLESLPDGKSRLVEGADVYTPCPAP